MAKFSPAYPQKPHTITKVWGVYDPVSYDQFGYDYHNGDDNVIPTDKAVHAPFAGTIVRLFDQPTGGGIGCGLLSDDIYDFDAWDDKGSNGTVFHFPAGQTQVLVDFLHCEKLLVVEGQKVKEGDLIAIPDNTGFTTGPHTHRQWRRETLEPITAGMNVSPAYRVLGAHYLQDFDKNDANNSFNPDRFWNGLFAQDIPALDVVVAKSEQVVSAITASDLPNVQKISWLEKVAQIIRMLFT